MTDNQRIIKRLIIIFIYILIFSSVSAGLYLLFRTPPTCADGKRNQGEEGVDCGGPCAKCEKIPEIENIQVLEKALVPAGQGKYDALAKIKNPNALFGVVKLDYSFDFFGVDGKILEKKSGSTFILPAEIKYAIAFNISLPEKPKSFFFRIESFRWQKFLEFQEPDIAVFGKELNFSGSENGAVQLKARIQNRSNFDFKKIATKVVLRNLKGLPIATNQTDNNDIRANEEREVIFNWNTMLPKDIDLENIEIEPEADVFSNDNFMKKFGSSEQYQSYGVEDLQ
ncbi:MAG: hypothetical protein QMD77_03680 [Patescibacteria group bacterium]|nr:hypothetical protein [Patescibacteria group bacterium]